MPDRHARKIGGTGWQGTHDPGQPPATAYQPQTVPPPRRAPTAPPPTPGIGLPEIRHHDTLLARVKRHLRRHPQG